MTTILRMIFPTLEPATSASIVGLVLATGVALAFLIGLARRRHSWWWLPMSIAAVGMSMTALGAWIGAHMFAGVWTTVAASGGGIGAISIGVRESAQLPLAASWIGLVTSLVAAMFLRPRASDDGVGGEGSHAAALSLLMTGALIIGLAPLLAFRPAMSFVWLSIMPGTAIPAGTVAAGVNAYETMSAICFVTALAVAVAITRLSRRSLRSQAVSFVTTIALLVTVAVFAFSAARLSDTSELLRELAHNGRVSAMAP